MGGPVGGVPGFPTWYMPEPPGPPSTRRPAAPSDAICGLMGPQQGKRWAGGGPVSVTHKRKRERNTSTENTNTRHTRARILTCWLSNKVKLRQWAISRGRPALATVCMFSPSLPFSPPISIYLSLFLYVCIHVCMYIIGSHADYIHNRFSDPPSLSCNLWSALRRACHSATRMGGAPGSGTRIRGRYGGLAAPRRPRRAAPP